MDAAELLALVRAELAPVERSLADHRYLVDLEAGRVPLKSLRTFAGEQRAIIASDRNSFEHLAHRFPEPPAGEFFRAYADFLLRTATLADYGELAAALLPCMWGYHELASRLAQRGRPGNELYARWIDDYAGAEYAELTSWCKELTNSAAATGDHRGMTETFLTSSRYELAFWNASWHEEAPLASS